MRATIVHESRGRMRLRLRQKNMTLRQADLLETWLKGQPWTREVVVHERTGCVIVTYAGDRETVLSAIGGFTWAGAEETVTLPGHSTRALNREFQEKLAGKVLLSVAAGWPFERYEALLGEGVITEAEFEKLEQYNFELPESERQPIDDFVVGEITTGVILI